ncbi:MAG: thiosulfate/3-mercaptopyruvate sulfurtransferase [Bradymonadia bacterium]|jgi:thiosulfate/3-mercaptopyruvate sulfurtransferase
MRRELYAAPLRSLVTALVVFTAACWPSAQTVAQSTEVAWLERAPELFVSAGEALSEVSAALPERPETLLLDARSVEDFAALTVRGSRNVPWQRLVDGERSGRLIDDPAELAQRLAGLAAPGDDIVVFGGWAGTNPLNAWGEEGRLWWSLKSAGYLSVRVVYGGFAALTDAGAPTGPGIQTVVESNTPIPSLSPSARWRANAEQVASVSAGAGAVLDTRTRLEFAGATLYGEREGGHIAGATLLWWRDVFASERDLLSPDDLDALLQSHGAARDEPLVAYCTGGIRSAFVVMLASALGYDARNYDGSIWEWTNELQRPLE